MRKIIVERFFKQQLPIDVPHVEKAMSAVMKVAKRDRADTAHCFPCRLMCAGDPDTFAIGSVTFTTVTKFNQQMAAKFDAYVRRDGSPLETEIDEGLLADAPLLRRLHMAGQSQSSEL